MKGRLVKKSVKASIKDAIAWAAMCGLNEPYSVPFAMSLGANAMGVGLLRSLPYLVSSIFQLFAQRFVLFMGRCKKALLFAVFTQSMSLFAAAFTVFLPQPFSLPAFIAMMVIYTMAGTMAAPPWSALMGEYIPASKRGNFFGFRYQIIGVTFFAFSYLAARILGYLPKNAEIAFFLVFSGAGAVRLFSWYYIGFMYEAPNNYHMPGSSKVGLAVSLDFRKGRTPALFFSVFMLLCATYLSAPFFSVYALKGLHCSYPRYMVLMSMGPLMTYLVMRRWGRAADVYGSVKVLKTGFLLIPLVPLLWTLTRDFYLLAAVETFSGIVWGAYLIGMNNFIYETAPAHARAGYNAVFNFIVGMAQFAGGLLGGFLYEKLPSWHGSSFIPLLLISALLRALAIVPLFRMVTEIRSVKAAGAKELFLAVAGFRQVTP